MAVTHLPAGIAAQERRELLRAALGRMRHVTGLPVTFGGEVSAGGRGVRLTEFAGTRTDALSGLVINTGNGLGGRVLAAARPGSVDDYAADSRISHEYDKPVTVEGLRAIGAVPVVVNESVVGVLYGGIRKPLPLGARVLDAMNHIAARLGAELTVRSEVERRMAELITKATREAPTMPGWEELREARAELRSIAEEITDPALRQRLQAICHRLTPSGRSPSANPLSARELDVLALIAE